MDRLRCIAFICAAAVSHAADLQDASDHLHLVQVRANLVNARDSQPIAPVNLAAPLTAPDFVQAALPVLPPVMPSSLTADTKSAMELELDSELDLQEAEAVATAPSSVALPTAEGLAPIDMAAPTTNVLMAPEVVLPTQAYGQVTEVIEPLSEGEDTSSTRVELQRPHPASWGPEHKMPQSIEPGSWGGIASPTENDLQALLTPPTPQPLVQALPLETTLASPYTAGVAAPLYTAADVQALPLEPAVYDATMGVAAPSYTPADVQATTAASPFAPVVPIDPALQAATSEGDATQIDFQYRKVADPVVRAWLVEEAEKLRAEHAVADAQAEVEAAAYRGDSTDEAAVSDSAAVSEDDVDLPALSPLAAETVEATVQAANYSEFPVVQVIDQTELFTTAENATATGNATGNAPELQNINSPAQMNLTTVINQTQFFQTALAENTTSFSTVGQNMTHEASEDVIVMVAASGQDEIAELEAKLALLKQQKEAQKEAEATPVAEEKKADDDYGAAITEAAASSATEDAAKKERDMPLEDLIAFYKNVEGQ